MLGLENRIVSERFLERSNFRLTQPTSEQTWCDSHWDGGTNHLPSFCWLVPSFCRDPFFGISTTLLSENSRMLDDYRRNAEKRAKRFGDNWHWYTEILIYSSIASVARNAGIKSRFLETRAHVATSVKIECYCHDRDNSSHGVCVGWCAASTAATSQVVIGCHGIDDAHRQVRAVSSNLFLFAFLSHTLPPHQPPPP